MVRIYAESVPCATLCVMVTRVHVGVVDQGFGKTGDYVGPLCASGAEVTVLRWQDGRDGAADAAAFDALVLCGGDDPAGRLFGQEDHPAITRDHGSRDAYEVALCRAAAGRRVPLLGVCRGLQMLNVALGGDLDQHIPDVRGRADHTAGVQHTLRLAAGSLIARLAAGAAVPTVNSYHHQAVGRVADALQASAWSEDGCIEAVEGPGPFCVGVQWHPEKDGNAPGLDLRLFAELVAAAAG